jgi:hypothetical protein
MSWRYAGKRLSLWDEFMKFGIAENMKAGFICCLAVICGYAWHLQHQLVLNADVSALLLATEKLLQGGNYIEDFFTPNPPMIMYLYMIPVLSAKFWHINITILFPFYIFVLISISFFICYRLVDKIFLKKDRLQGYVFLSMLAIVFLVVPTKEFGQRDHLLVIMTLPYLLLTVCRMKAQAVNQGFAMIIGLFAGMVIAFKPQYLMLPALIESYFMFYKKNWLAWVKPETLVLMLVLMLYVALVLLTRQDYVAEMMPFLIKYYYGGATDSLQEFLFNNCMLFVYAAIPVYILLNRMNKYAELGTVLTLALTVYTFCYWAQSFAFYYHMIPSFSLALLVLAQLYINLVMREDLSAYDYRVIASATLGMLILLWVHDKLQFSLLSVDPVLLVGFSITFFLILLSALKVKRISSILVLLPVSYLFSYLMLANMLFRTQLYLLVTLLLLLASGLFAKYAPRLFHSVFVIVLGVLFFVYPGMVVMNKYNLSLRFKYFTLNKLISFVHTQPPHQSIYELTTSLVFACPLVNYTDVVVKQRFTDGLWMFRGSNTKLLAQDNNKNHIVDMVAEDMRHNQPDLVFVDNSDVHFNLLNYSLQNKNFSQIWQHYHYLTTVAEAGIYKLDVYKLDNGIKPQKLVGKFYEF